MIFRWKRNPNKIDKNQFCPFSHRFELPNVRSTVVYVVKTVVFVLVDYYFFGEKPICPTMIRAAVNRRKHANSIQTKNGIITVCNFQVIYLHEVYTCVSLNMKLIKDIFILLCSRQSTSIKNIITNIL